MASGTLADIAQRIRSSTCLNEARAAAASGRRDGPRPTSSFAIGRSSDLFIVCPDNRIRSMRLRDVKLQRPDVMRVLSFDGAANARIHRGLKLLFNRSSDLLAVHDSRSLSVIPLNAQIMQSAYAHGKDMLPLPCSLVSVMSVSSEIIVHVAWHPHSDRHICVLTRDHSFQMYLVTQSLAQLEYQLDLSAIPLHRSFVHFSFSSTTGGWGPFTIYFLDDIGSIYVACPVVPFGLQLNRKQIQQLLTPSTLQQAVQRWIAAFWQPSQDTFYFNPARANDEWTTAIQGPLRFDTLPTTTPPENVASSFASFPIPPLNLDLFIIAFQAGHVQIALQCAPVSPSWIQQQYREAAHDDGVDCFFVTQVHTGSSELVIIARAMKMLYLDAVDGVLRMNCAPLIGFLIDRYQDTSVPFHADLLHPPVQTLSDLPRSGRIASQICSDPLIGDFLCTITTDFDVDMKSTSSFVSPSSGSTTTRLASKPSDSPTERVLFAVDPFAAPAPVQLLLRPDELSALTDASSSDSLRVLIGFSNKVCDTVDDIAHQQTIYRSRHDFLEKLFECQQLYMSRLQAILDVLGRRQVDLATTVKARRESAQHLSRRITQCADQIKQWNNGVLPSGQRIRSGDEAEFALELERTLGKASQFKAVLGELSARVAPSRSGQAAAAAGGLASRSSLPLVGSHLARMHPVIQAQTSSLRRCQEQLLRLHGRINDQFPSLT